MLLCAVYIGGSGCRSYVAMISKAILSSPNNRLSLADIYAFIGRTFFWDHHQQQYTGDYNTRDRAWRNNVRHHLSINECFVRVCVGGRLRRGRGRGSLWAIHVDCLDHFRRGDYSPRRWTVSRPCPQRCSNNTQHTQAKDDADGGYVTMTKRKISPSDELYTNLISARVFAKTLEYKRLNLLINSNLD